MASHPKFGPKQAKTHKAGQVGVGAAPAHTTGDSQAQARGGQSHTKSITGPTLPESAGNVKGQNQSTAKNPHGNPGHHASTRSYEHEGYEHNSGHR